MAERNSFITNGWYQFAVAVKEALSIQGTGGQSKEQRVA
jgi:hypothetical protein